MRAAIEDGDGNTAHARFTLLIVNGVTATANAFQVFAEELAGVQRLGGEALKPGLVENLFDTRRGRQREDRLADGGAVNRVAHANAGGHADTARGLLLVEVNDV